MRVIAPSRLHFGLLGLGSQSETARQFGGAGMMIDAPGILLQAVSAAAWSAEGPLGERVLAFAHTFLNRLSAKQPAAVVPPHHFLVEGSPPEHVGLGTGTQLGLAVARVLAEAAGLADVDVVELAHLAGRGARSALGIHGFAQGGFLVEGGKRGSGIAPLIARIPFPEDWRVVLVIPQGEKGLHGPAEQEIFQQIAKRSTCQLQSQTDALCRIVLLGMMPALLEKDIEVFGESVHEFNTRAGELFAPIQGGIYAGKRVSEVVDFVRGLGINGVGQSSWGPAVFALVGDAQKADLLVQRIRSHFGFGAGEALHVRACNGGAVVDI